VKLLLQTTGGKVFAGAEVTTNKFGVAATKLPLAKVMPEGDYELVVLYNKARERARLRVERFVPPVMQIDHDIKRFLTSKQDSLVIKVNLSYFAGGIPEQARLELTALSAGGKKLVEKSFESDKIGLYFATLVKKDLDKIRTGISAEQPFKIKLTATDEFDRTSEVTRDVVYTERPYRAVLEFDKDDYPPGELVKLHAKVVDLDGKPAKKIPLVCAVQEFSKEVKATTDNSGVAEFTFIMGKTAATAVVTSPVMALPLASKAVRLNNPKPMTSKASEPPNKQGVQTHITVTFDKKYRPVEKVVHVDFTDLSGALVMSTTIPVSFKDGIYRAEGTVTAHTWGTMLANLYVCAVEKAALKKDDKLSLKNVGFITEGQHVTLHPDAEATITIEGLKPRVRPGERLDLTVRVKTRSGEDASVGAALVDNAVVSLMDPLEVTPTDHFYNPQRKVISTGGAGVLTWPIVDRNWGEPWRDIAYTNWGWKAPGDLVHGGDEDPEEGEMEGGIGGGVMGASGKGSVSGAGYGGLGMAKKSKVMMKLKSSVKPAKPAMMAKEEAKHMELADGAPSPEMELDKDSTVEGEDRQRQRNGGSKPKARPKVITIRTKFPETALWEPLLETKKGVTKLRVEFPDAITVQRLTLIASDKSGGLGLLHEMVEVRQDLFVQADLPASMTMGDEVRVIAVVRNLSGRFAEVTLTPTASGLDFVGETEKSARVANGESVAVEWMVKASFCGEVSFNATAETTEARDVEQRKAVVLPAGEPVSKVERGKLVAGEVYATTLTVDQKATYATAVLNVSFPNVIPALQAWGTLQELPMAYVGVSGVSGRALIDAGLLAWGREMDQSRKWQKAFEERLSRAASELLAAQNPDGSWGWFYMADASNDQAGYVINIYLSAFALRALAEIAKLGLLPDKKALTSGISFLLESRNDEGLWSPTAWFWEFNAPETNWGLSGDLFETIVMAASQVDKKPSKELVDLKKKFDAFMAGKPDDPAAVAHTLGALVQWHNWQPEKVSSNGTADMLQYLLTLKRKAYWEPHWYHAYGGMVELNARILVLLREIGKGQHVGIELEIIEYLLSTREAWGAWHNEIGTAHAVQALLAAGAGQKEEKPSIVTIKVNGQKVKEVGIDPEKPFMSAANLRFVDLTPYLQAGSNKLELAYDGALQAPVMVETKQWGLPKPVRKKPIMKPKTVGHLSIRRHAPEEARLGQPVDIILDVQTDKALSHVQIVDSIPSTTEVDTRHLDGLVKSGKLLAYDIKAGKLYFFLPRLDDEFSFTYRLVAARVGVAHHSGAKVAARYRRGFRPGVVSGGELRVVD
jgi:uncharacterized protein YfaS (alpha-2-macroglobulin family)